MGCSSSNSRKSRIGSFDNVPTFSYNSGNEPSEQSLLHFNILNMLMFYFPDQVINVERIKIVSERFKLIKHENVNFIILTIRPDSRARYITTVWESLNSLPYNIRSREIHYTSKDLDNYTNQLFNKISIVKTNSSV